MNGVTPFPHIYVDAGAPFDVGPIGVSREKSWVVAACLGDGRLIARREVEAPSSMTAEAKAIDLGIGHAGYFIEYLSTPVTIYSDLRSLVEWVLGQEYRGRSPGSRPPRSPEVAWLDAWALRKRTLLLAATDLKLDWVPGKLNPAHKHARRPRNALT